MDEYFADELMLSFVCPIHNGDMHLESFHQQLTRVADDLGAAYEIIFVNDGSTDESMDIIRSLAKRDGAVRYLDLSRRFGLPAALVAGCTHASGSAVVATGVEQSLDHVGTLIERWQGGWEIVHATGTDGRVSGDSIGLRLLDHRAAKSLCQWYDPQRSIDQVLDEIGFRRMTVACLADVPHAKARPDVGQMSWGGLLGKSTGAGRWFGRAGIALVAAAVVYSAVGGVLALMGVMAFSVVLPVLLLIAGTQTLCLAGILECLRQVGSRPGAKPLYVIRHRHGFGNAKMETPQRVEAQEHAAARFTVLT